MQLEMVVVSEHTILVGNLITNFRFVWRILLKTIHGRLRVKSYIIKTDLEAVENYKSSYDLKLSRQ
jgi:hypothetical protein